MNGRLSVAFLFLGLTAHFAAAQVPGLLNYQGRVAVSGTNFTGTGQFKFALVNGAGSATFWSNGTATVSLPVTKGLYGVLLGDTSVANMAALAPAVFTNSDVRLRVWFDSGSGLQQLVPDQRIAAAAYALAVPASGIAGTLSDGALSPNVALLSGSPSFSGTVTAAAYAGNGAGLTNMNASLSWQVVSGMSVQALANRGYLLTNDALVTVMLPAAPSPGAIVRISGSGTNGWRISQNAGQSVRTANHADYAGRVWVPRIWASHIACSADGSKLVATASSGQLYTSTDSGVTWILQAASPSSAYWRCVASSADGSKLVAAAYGQLYTSADSGTNWTARAISANQWYSVASSADGTRLVAAVYGGHFYTSTDSGVTWILQAASPLKNWTSVASSADGSKLVAGVNNGQLYISTDSGTNWTGSSVGSGLGGGLYWTSVASSADGTKRIAVALGSQIYTSQNVGDSWIKQNSDVRNWLSVASSADGTKLIAGADQLYTSQDSGMTWTMQANSNRPAMNWGAVACSAEGGKLFASSGYLYTSSFSTSPGGTGYLQGG